MKTINSGRRNRSNCNCVNCSVAYDLRRRGYDVKAAYREKGRDDYFELYKGTKVNLAITETDNQKRYSTSKKEHSVIDTFYREMDQKMPNNSRGFLALRSPYLGIGHAVAWEKNKGELTIRDCQTGKITTRQQLENFRYKDIYAVRTDNLEPNWDKIGSAIRYKKKGE